MIPVSLDVWGFELPSISSLKTAFGFNGVAALKQHAGRYTNDDDLRAISHFVYLPGLRSPCSRVSAFGGPMIPPPFTLSEQFDNVVDWSQYDAEVGSFLSTAPAFRKATHCPVHVTT